MYDAKFIINFIDIKANTYSNISNFLTTHNIPNNNSVIIYFKNIISDIFTQILNLKHNFINVDIEDSLKTRIPNNNFTPIPKKFTNLSINNFNLNVINNNKNIINHIDLLNLNNQNITPIYKIINTISITLFPVKSPIRNSSRYYSSNGYIPANNLNPKFKFYKILKFTNIDVFKNIFNTYIVNDDNIYNYELHVDNSIKNNSTYYLLIEFAEEYLNNIYEKFTIPFKTNSKRKYQEFLNKKGSLIDPESL